MKKEKRQTVYKKYDGHCAYCGKKIDYKDMQVDHITPLCHYGGDKNTANRMENLNPACRRCNHYKRAWTLEDFRDLMLTIHKRILKIYICKVAKDYGVINVIPWDGVFYFEKTGSTGR